MRAIVGDRNARPDGWKGDHAVHARNLPKHGELPWRLEDRLVERTGAKLLGESTCIQGVVPLPTARRYTCDRDVVDVRSESLVEPSALRALLDYEMASARNQADRLDERPAVGFHGKARQALSAL